MSALRGHRSMAVIAVAAVALVTGCSDDGDGDGAAGTTLPAASSTAGPTSAPVTTAPATTPATTVPATTQPPATQPPATQTPSTDPPGTDPPEECVAPVGREAFDEGFPDRMSAMVGSDIRTGAHACFERVVIELAGPGDMPGVRVEYVDDPVHLSPSDQTVEIEGDATLVISVAAWMPSMDGDGYAGPTQFHPTNVSHIVEVRQIENFEGMTAWAIGLDEERDFSVDLLGSPARIVIDFASA